MHLFVVSDTPSSHALSASRTAIVRLAKPVCAENWPPGPAAKAFSVFALSYSSSALSCASFNGNGGGSNADAWLQPSTTMAKKNTILRGDNGMLMVTVALFGLPALSGGSDHKAF